MIRKFKYLNKYIKISIDIEFSANKKLTSSDTTFARKSNKEEVILWRILLTFVQ